MLEDATLAAEDAQLARTDLCLADLDTAPADGFVPWLKDRVRRHRAFKHPYYREFIRHEASPADLRRYLVQESVVDGRFDDLLALLQLGTDGTTKLEIAENYWDEMGNGDPELVHTLMFSRALDTLAISDVEMREEMSAEGLLSGNLAMLLSRYRETFPEAVGFLAVTEWLVPDRFSNVLAGWRRLGLDPAGIEYHDGHIAIDARHASGWFTNVVKPGTASAPFRRGVTRGALWRLNSSARYLDANLARARR
ncbi:MAG: iron-containing redox enzyme family protein [Tetrasphaera sp.]